MELMDGFRAAAEQANLLTTFALAIVGGSIVALLQTTYLRPVSRCSRAVYLLFVPAWYFLGTSIYDGSQVRAVHLSYLFGTTATEEELIGAVSQHAASQSNGLLLGLAVLAVWLALYLAWWIYTDKPAGER